jgi:hypothetical protein
MQLNELWKLYEADKCILGFSPHTLKAYSLQLRMLLCQIGNLEIDNTFHRFFQYGKILKLVDAFELATPIPK